MPVKYFAPKETETIYHLFFLLQLTVVKIKNNLNVCSAHIYLYSPPGLTTWGPIWAHEFTSGFHSEVRVAQTLVFCVVFCRSLSYCLIFRLAIVLSVLRFMDSYYLFGIFINFFGVLWDYCFITYPLECHKALSMVRLLEQLNQVSLPHEV